MDNSGRQQGRSEKRNVQREYPDTADAVQQASETRTPRMPHLERLHQDHLEALWLGGMNVLLLHSKSKRCQAAVGRPPISAFFSASREYAVQIL